MRKQVLSFIAPWVIAIAAISLFLISLSPQEAESKGKLGVTNFDAVHMRDTNATATPVLLADQRGLGSIAEFRDSATPVARIPNGGGMSLLVGGLTLADGLTFTPGSEAVIAGFTISGTTRGILSLTSTAEVTSSTSAGIITTTATSGDVLILVNNNAADIIRLDGTGGSIECKADVALGAQDTAILVYNGTGAVWNCLAVYDNS